MAERIDYASLKKGGFMKQKQQGFFCMRVAVVGGKLTASNLKVITDISEKYGNGTVHLTSRQSVEIPFLKYEDIEQVKAELAKDGLAPAVCGAGVRTITACQGAEICNSGCIDTYALAKELNERYFGRQIPHKFKIGVTGCRNNCLKTEENDLGIKGGYVIEYKSEPCISCGLCVKACRNDALSLADGKIVYDKEKCINCGRCVKACPVKAWDYEPGYVVSFGGLFGNTIYKGEQIVPIITDKDTLLRVADAAIKFFEDNAKAGERFRFTIQRVGEDEFRKAILNAYVEK